MVTDSAGVIKEESDYFPYGGERVLTDLLPKQNYKFTGKERDTESGLDYFGARYYASRMGRWLTPDWANGAEAVPYADFGDPQSLNLYGYVGNQPVTRFDADGHCPGPPCIYGFAEQQILIGGVKEAWNVVTQGLNDVAAVGDGLAQLYLGTEEPTPQLDLLEMDNDLQQVGADLVDGGTLAYTATKLSTRPFEIEQPATNTSGERATVSKSSTEQKLKAKPPGENQAAADGRAAHKAFDAKVKAKPGWKSQPKLTDPKSKKPVIPDAQTPSSRPLELKPNTPSGRAKGRSQLKKQERATGKKGRVVYYDHNKKP